MTRGIDTRTFTELAEGSGIINTRARQRSRNLTGY